MSTTWREQIIEKMKEHGESWDDVEMANIGEIDWYTDELSSIGKDELFDEKFDNGYGGTNGKQFLVWTKNRVYYPICYDGAEWASSAPRNPTKGLIQKHDGGWISNE